MCFREQKRHGNQISIGISINTESKTHITLYTIHADLLFQYAYGNMLVK